MKKRTGIIGVLVAILLLGIGYAVVSAVTLTINGSGSITADQANFKVHYTGDVTVTKSVAKVRVFFIATNAKTFFLSQKAVFLTYFNEKQSEFLFYLKQLHNFAATHSNTCKKRSTSRQGKYWPTHWSSFYWHWS